MKVVRRKTVRKEVALLSLESVGTALEGAKERRRNVLLVD